MTEFLMAAAIFVMAMVALGLIRVALGPTDPDRMMAVQLLGTGSIVALMLIGVATRTAAVIDVALALALLAAFASVVVATGGQTSDRATERDNDA